MPRAEEEYQSPSRSSARPGRFEHYPARDSTGGDIVRILIAILLPPLGVLLEAGLGKAFWLNVLLTLLGYIPGIVHAVYIIARR